MRRLGALAILLSVAVAGLALAASGLAEAPGSSVEIAGESASEGALPTLQAETVKGAPDESTISLPLLIRSPGVLAVEYVGPKTAEHSRLGDKLRTDKTSLSGASPLRRLRAGEILILKLRFKTPAGSKDPLSGLLSIRTGDGAPLVRKIEAAPASSGQPKPTQKKIEISVTSWDPFAGVSSGSAVIGIVGGEPGGKKPLGSSYLSFNHGGHAKVSVAAPVKEGSVETSKVNVSDASGTGTATTVIDLGGKEVPAQQLEVVVSVSDFFVFPLIVVFIGVALGKILPTWLDTRRQRGMARAPMLEAQEEYEAAREKATAWAEKHQPPTFDTSLGLGDQDGKATAISLEDGTFGTLFSRLDRDVYAPHRLEGDLEQAEKLTNALKGWAAVAEAMSELADVSLPVSDLPGSHPFVAPFEDAQILLDEGFAIDSDLSRWTRVADAMHRQKLILEVSRKLNEASPDAPALELATAAYDNAKPPLVCSAEESEVILGVLRKALYRGATAAGPDADRVAMLNFGDAAVSIRSGLLQIDGILPRLGKLAHPAKAPTPESIMASVRRGDWWLAFAAFIVSAAAYLLPIYASGPFGTRLQYLGAFVAGVAVQLTASSVVLPWARSYKPTPASPPASPPTG